MTSFKHIQHTARISPEMLDPVCGMQVNETTASAKSEYNGKAYYFCSPGCKVRFDANPEACLGHSESRMPPSPQAAHSTHMDHPSHQAQSKATAVESAPPTVTFDLNMGKSG